MPVCDCVCVDDMITLTFPDGSVLHIKKTDFDRIFGKL